MKYTILWTAVCVFILTEGLAVYAQRCPPIDCTIGCVEMDEHGCPVCKCDPGPGIGRREARDRRQLTLQGIRAMSTALGCERFPPYCRLECTSVDTHGCLVCSCPAVSNNTSTTGSGGSLSSSSSVDNNGGCPKLRSDCNFDCITIGATGCLECTCTGSGSPTSLSGGSSLTGSGAGGQPSGAASSLTGGATLTGSGTTSGSSQSLTGGATLTGSGSASGSPQSLTGGATLTGSGTASGSPQSLTGGATLTGSGTASGSPQSLTGGATLTGPGTGVQPNPNNTSSSGNGGSLSSAASGDNSAGCPKLPSDCNLDCLTIGAAGCLECTCTGNAAPSSLTGGATLTGSGSATGSVQSLTGGATLTGSGSGAQSGSNNSSSGTGSSLEMMTSANSMANNNGCPAFSAGCTAECLGLDAQGCPVCNCHHAGSAPSSGMTSSSTDHQMTSGASSNANGCPTFLATCPQECVSLDGHGCPVCICSNSSGQTSSSQVQGSTGNNNGCPTFPSNCGSDCVSLDAMGCPLCSCTQDGNNSGTGSSGSPATGANPDNNNGCPVFLPSCTAECTTTNDQGCPICQCPGGGPNMANGNNSSVSGQDCPALLPNCNTACLYTADNGCVICLEACNAEMIASMGPNATISGGPTEPGTATAGGSSSGSTSGSSGVVTCPAIDILSCPTECASFDAKGCLICTCTANTGSHGGSTGGHNMNGCDAFDASCPSDCVSIDSHGCLFCTCAKGNNTSTGGGTGSGTGNGAGTVQCPAFDGLHCNPTCMKLDSQGCLICDCGTSAGGSGTTSGSVVTQAPVVPGGVSGGASTYAPSLGEVNQTVSGGGGSSASSGNNNNGCPPFDTSCKAGCASLDANGCLTCTCSSPAGGSSGGTSTGTGGSGSNGSGCPAFDASCPSSCVTMDAMGCLACTCSGSTMAPTAGHLTLAPLLGRTTAAPNAGSSLTTAAPFVPGGGAATTFTPGLVGPGQSGTGSGSGCPTFDTSCPSGCATIDSNGCIVCNCGSSASASTMAPGLSISTVAPSLGGTTSATGTGNSGNSNGCATFDASCPSSCVSMDAMGCLTCTCSGNSTGGSGNQNPNGSGGMGTGSQPSTCPPVDVMSCTPECIQMDKNNCVFCACTSSTKSPPVVTTTVAATTVAPTTVAATTTTVSPRVTRPTVPMVTHTCSKFDGSCDSKCTYLDHNGCLQCSCPATQTPVPMTTIPPTTAQPLAVQTTTLPARTCPPIRCLYPCDKVGLGADNCPVCKCQPSTTAATAAATTATP